jgi:hypothetical protein
MTCNALIVVFGLIALFFVISAIRSLRRRQIAGGAMQFLFSALLLACAAAVALLAANLRTYQRLTGEQPAADLELTRVGDHQFIGALTIPSGERTQFALRGDEWQVDARVLKWKGLATLLGFDTAYRLDRIGGRYTDIDDERRLPRTVYALNPRESLDLWELVHRYHAWVPWIDALYGSATYLPMADGARYEITVSQSGLVARPLNPSAVTAVGNWH